MTTKWRVRDTRVVFAITALAFAVRAVQASFGQVVGADGPQFLLTAMEIIEGDWTTGLTDGIHPVYPLAIIGFGTLLGSIEAGGIAAAVVFGSLTTVPFFMIVRDACGRRTAAVAALFLACLPYFIREHSEVMSEGIFHCIFVTTLALTWFAVTRGSIALYALAGLAGGIAYLTRPEGIYCPAAIVGLTVLANFRKDRSRWKAHVVGTVIALALWLAVSLPLLVWIRATSGQWLISIRGSVARAQGLEVDANELLKKKYEARSGWGRAMGHLLWQVGRTSFWIVLVFAIWGACVARGRIVPLAAAFFACVIVGYIGPPIIAGARGHPLSHRYVLVSVMFLLPFAGIAWSWAFDRFPSRAGRAVLGATLGVLLMAGIVRGVHPRFEDLLPVRECAAWLKERGAGNATIHASSRLVGVYVGKRPRDLFLHRIPSRMAVEEFEAGPGDYVVVVDDHVKQVPGWEPILAKRHRLVATFPASGDRRYQRVTVWVRK